MNRVSLTGRITRDPEIRYSSNGSSYLMFTIAVDRQQRDASGQRMADFISCTAFGQIADFISRYVKKGFMLAVSGRIQTRNFQGQDGQTHYVTEVVCENVENLTPRDPNSQTQNNNEVKPQYQNQQSYNNPSYGSNSYNQGYQSDNNNQQSVDSYNVSVDDNDLPF